ncbi:MAG: MBL fold metallo-hydrolase [Thermoguttaceae bacterium]|jgi:ribonuclease BN (tRNA processing enzyme)
MKLVLLGTAGYHPSDHRQTMCMMIPECGIMLDAGTGAYRAGRYLQTPELDIFLTHAHLDHVVGLTYLLELSVLHPLLRRMTLHGEAAKLAAIDTHLLDPVLFPKRPPMDLQPLTDQPVALAGGGRLTWFPLAHPGGSVGLRLDWPGHSLAYVTDTTAVPGAAYVEHIRGADLLVHECYFSDAQGDWARRTGHSCTSAVAELAREAAVGRLLLTHINPLAAEEDPVNLPAARAIFPQCQVAADGMVVEF